MTTGTLDHASCGTSTRAPSRRRCPKTSDAPTISPAGSGGSSFRRHAASATGSPRNAAKSSRRFIEVHAKTQRVKKAQRESSSFAAPVLPLRLCVKLPFILKSFPLAFVISHQHLVIEAVDLHRHGLDVIRERKHRGECLVVEKLQSRHRISRHVERCRSRKCKPPEPETRHRGVIRSHHETCGFERPNNAP